MLVFYVGYYKKIYLLKYINEIFHLDNDIWTMSFPLRHSSKNITHTKSRYYFINIQICFGASNYFNCNKYC
jgi:hypothetical protein